MAESLSETELIVAASQGNRRAFAVLVERHWEPLRRWLWGLTRQEQVAEDLTQEAFFRAWKALPKLREVVVFRAWLFRIARHLWVDQCRAAGSVAAEPLLSDFEDRTEGPLAAILNDETRQRVQAAIDGLPERYRSVFLLWVREAMPYSQIASVCDISEEKARWRVYKARQILLNHLRLYLDPHKP